MFNQRAMYAICGVLCLGLCALACIGEDEEEAPTTQRAALCERALLPTLQARLNVTNTTIEVSQARDCTLTTTHPDGTRRTWGMESIPNRDFAAEYARLAEAKRDTPDYVQSACLAAYWDPDQQRLVGAATPDLAFLIATRDLAQSARLVEAAREDEFGGRWRRELTQVMDDLCANPDKLAP